MGKFMVACEHCGVVQDITNFTTFNCTQCGAPLRNGFAYYPVFTPETRTAMIAAADSDWPITGIDCSKWQGVMDWVKAAERANFAFIRAGYGNAYVDEQLAANARGCRENGMPYGIYWYTTPDKDWRKHADSLVAAYTEYGGDLPPVMDAEETGGLDKQRLAGWYEKFINRFEGITGKRLAIYTSPGFWNTNMPLTNWAKHHPLWVAHWTAAAQPTLPFDWMPKNNPNGYPWTFWQYTAKGDGALYGAQSKSIDLNRFNGDAAAFRKAFGVDPHFPGDTPPPEPPAEGYPRDITLVGNYNLRRTPEIANNLISTLPAGTKLTVEGEDGEWYKVQAYIHKDSDG